MCLCAGDLPETVEGVFVFQEGAESDSPAGSAFDAIVVEQWTVIHVSVCVTGCVMCV